MTSKLIRRERTCLSLAVTIIVASTLTSVNFARGGKPSPAPAPYSITDLGSPRYSNRHLLWRRAYEINEPDNQGLMDIIGWDGFGSAVWGVSASGGVVSRDNLAADMKVTAVNDNGLIVGRFGDYEYLFANVPGVGMVVLPGSELFNHAAVNNLGRVVAQSPALEEGAMWTIAADGSVSEPVSLGDFRPMDINDWDEMVGMQDTTATIAWFEEGALQTSKLPGLWPGDFGVATAINNWGEVAGYSLQSTVNSGTYLPFLWTPDQGLTALGSLGGVHGVAIDINDGGTIVGWSYTNSPRNSEQHAFLWENGTMLDLNGQLESNSKRTLQSADGINNAGHIVGSMFTVQSGTTTLKSFLLTPKP